MKIITTFLFCVFAITLSQAQWQPTGISTNTIEGVFDIVSHNNELFASVNTAGFIKSTDNGSTWNPVGQTGFTTNNISRRVIFTRSNGTALYTVTFYANNASSMIYKSVDNGQTFTPDITGLPVNSGEVVDIDYFYMHNDYVVAVVGSGNYIKHINDASWQRNNSTSTEFSEHFAFYGNKFYAWGNYHLNTSTNNGQTWTTSVDANLPPYFLANNLIVDSSSGRIYVSGRSLFNYIHKLYYSDNDGATWTEINIASYLTNNWIGTGQTIQELFVRGNYIQFALDNNMNPSAPDIFVSTNGGTSFAQDISGLPTNATGTTTAVKFFTHNSNLFMALSYIDIYKKPFSTLSTSNKDFNTSVHIYPNPSNGIFNIDAINKINEIQIFNVQGKLVQSLKPSGLISSFKIEAKGIYLVKITDDNNNSTVKKVIRN